MAAKILVIEDEPAIADNINYALDTEGFSPIWCSTGQAGLEALAAQAVDLVVLDIGLPDRNGFDLFREIRSITQAPVIFLTARGSEVDRVSGLEMGADDYMVKPFSPRELTARIRAVLRRAQRRSEDAAAKDSASSGAQNFPFEIDEERRRITFFGSALELSRYEYRLLKVLIKRPGWVFSRDKLMELAWEEPEMSLERTVDAHIKSIRSKLNTVRKDVEVIITHRGVGYSLKEDW